MIDDIIFRALASPRRRQILAWLLDPVANFRPQRDGDLVADGVCSLFIAQKLGVSQPTAGKHLELLVRAGLVRPKPIKQWVFYRRDEDRILAVKQMLGSDW